MPQGNGKLTAPSDWYRTFFGKFYMRGDDSITGYRPGEKETLKERTAREASGVASLLNLKPPARILDVPTGYGRHAIELSNKGYQVTGLDICEEHLEAARASAGRQGAPAEFVNADMRSVPAELHGKFDVVINMFFSFGFFPYERENVQAMEQFNLALKEGGQMLLHTDVSPEMIEAGTYRLKPEKRPLPDGSLLRINEAYDPLTSRLSGTWTIDGETRPYDVRIYSAREFEEMALSCGFREAKVYGSFNGEPFTPESGEMIVVARK